MQEITTSYGTGYFENNCTINVKWSDKWIILTEVKCNPSLADTMSSALHCIIEELGERNVHLTRKNILLWKPNEGLFEVKFDVKEKPPSKTWITPSFEFINIEYVFFSKDMKGIELFFNK